MPVNAVDRAFRILNLFDNGQTELGVSDVSRILGLNKSTAHGILQTLAGRDILVQNTVSLKYRLGPGLVVLGDLARQRLDLRELARPALAELANASGETAFLGVLEHDGITIVEKADSPDPFRITAPLGQRVPFCAGSFGRALSAFLPPAEVTRLLREKGLRAFTPASITDPAAFRLALETTRRQGYAVDETEEYLPGAWAVSAPVRDGRGVVAAITVVALTARMNPPKAEQLIRAAVAAADEISRRLGGSPLGDL